MVIPNAGSIKFVVGSGKVVKDSKDCKDRYGDRTKLTNTDNNGEKGYVSLIIIHSLPTTILRGPTKSSPTFHPLFHAASLSVKIALVPRVFSYRHLIPTHFNLYRYAMHQLTITFVTYI